MRNTVKTYLVNSPAKINIGLRVLSKRKDGYHNIETFFYPVKLYDTIEITIKKLPPGKLSKVNVTAGGNKNISGEKNICYKAAVMFLEKFNIKELYNINIKITKNIPMGAGLGGGSSNAAAVLKALTKHFKLNLKTKNIKSKLAEIAIDLGSDVPVFLLNTPAYGTGRGEKLTPLPDFKINGKILIVNPGIHISTPWAFKELKVKRSKRSILGNIKKFSPANERLMINDFERVVFKKYPEIEKIKYGMLSLRAEYALMSGSGSTLYGVFSRNKIKQAEAYFRKYRYKVFTA